MDPFRRRRAGLPARRRPGGFLAALIACWLLAQALGQAHAVLHPRRAPIAATPAASPLPAQASADTGRGTRPPAALRGDSASAAAQADRGPVPTAHAGAFHPRGDAAAGDDGVCRLYSQLAQGDLAGDAAPSCTACGGCAGAAPSAAVAAAAVAPRRGTQARAPPAAG